MFNSGTAIEATKLYIANIAGVNVDCCRLTRNGGGDMRIGMPYLLYVVVGIQISRAIGGIEPRALAAGKIQLQLL